jgi:hypothetical protein
MSQVENTRIDAMSTVPPISKGHLSASTVSHHPFFENILQFQKGFAPNTTTTKKNDVRQ